jgi:hypothetical protein
VRQIDHAEDAEHQRQAAGDQKQDHPILNGIQKLNAEGYEVHSIYPVRKAA